MHVNKKVRKQARERRRKRRRERKRKKVENKEKKKENEVVLEVEVKPVKVELKKDEILPKPETKLDPALKALILGKDKDQKLIEDKSQDKRIINADEKTIEKDIIALEKHGFNVNKTKLVPTKEKVVEQKSVGATKEKTEEETKNKTKSKVIEKTKNKTLESDIKALEAHGFKVVRVIKEKKKPMKPATVSSS